MDAKLFYLIRGKSYSVAIPKLDALRLAQDYRNYLLTGQPLLLEFVKNEATLLIRCDKIDSLQVHGV